MFSITPYAASRYVVQIKDGETRMNWQPCQVIGVDSSGDEPSYLVEVRSANGEFHLDRADVIRKCPPTA
ncbi:hypothetical protein AB4Z43_02195 [Mesorhizobium sp. 2RAF45]|uniref:hypothetical protein n=1 Tax=Mesorhizobium sp. 2RAF45 TaxID=3233001 RepID=UPI003F970DAB